jgi:uncharacterized protein
MTATLYTGTVYHARHRPFFHEFTYKVFTLGVDIDDLPTLSATHTLFGYNRFALFGFYDRDHGPRDGRPLRPWIEAAAHAKGLDITGGKILFLGFPRVLGYVFNPLSLFFLYDRTGALKAIMHQVKNTFGEQHCYLLPVDPEKAGNTITQDCGKIFHVSPFLPMDCQYHFRVVAPSDHFFVAIHQTVPEGKILTATWDGANPTPLSDRALWALFWRIPVMTVKIIGAIHWQALKLWLKGARFHKSPPPPADMVT